MVRLIYSDQFRVHGVDSTFRSGSVKDDLFIREDVVSKYSLASTTSTTNTNTQTTLPTPIRTSSSKNKVEL